MAAKHNLPLHQLSIRNIKTVIRAMTPSTEFSYNDLLGEWDRRRAVWRDRFLMLAGLLTSLAAMASFFYTMGWLDWLKK